jgi:hypothetical protein
MVCGEVFEVAVESVTWMVRLELPEVVGVPAISPVDVLRDNPAGRLPLAIDQVYGAVPPPAVSDELYAPPTMPLESVPPRVKLGWNTSSTSPDKPPAVMRRVAV